MATELPVLTRLDEARALIERFAELGAVTEIIETGPGKSLDPSNYMNADVQFTFYESGESCERIAAALLDAYPDTRLRRFEGGGNFNLTCPGRPSWSAYFSDSMCTRVKTGTRTVTKPDPVALESVPLIEVEEPVYEWRCADPLADMAVSA